MEHQYRDKNEIWLLAHQIFDDEVKVLTSRSGWKWWQNVNKTETRIQIQRALEGSHLLPEQAKQRLLQLKENHVDDGGVLRMSESWERYQHLNRSKIRERFTKLIHEAFTHDIERIETKPTLWSKIKRLDQKTKHSNKKEQRKKPVFDD